MASREMRAALVRAIDEQHIVRVERAPKFADGVERFVLRVGAESAFLAQVPYGTRYFAARSAVAGPGPATRAG